MNKFAEAEVGSLWCFKQLPEELLQQGEFTFITVYDNLNGLSSYVNRKNYIKAGTPIMKLAKEGRLMCKENNGTRKWTPIPYYKVLFTDNRDNIRTGWIIDTPILFPYSG